jgi:carbamoyl-phosphate synthase large subunit
MNNKEPIANGQKPKAKVIGQKAVLIFGVGPLQASIINRAKKMGLYTVGIDPCEDATCKDCVDAFEVVGGQDFDGTCAIVDKYGIDAIVTAATDKPLVMMARIAEKYGFPFYSVETAKWSTDKFQMKQRFELGGVPHARGILLGADDISHLPLAVSNENEPKANSQQPTASIIANGQELFFPVIIKPRDNSGSRGVKLCRSKEELEDSMSEAFEVSKLDTVLVEEFIEGPEYSIEGLHYDGKSEVIQFTEKKTTEFPYNVELGHIQPANISEENKQKIREIEAKIGTALNFVNCPSHTELKINERGIYVIETSPRLGGDYITSTLTPLSTGVNVEDELLKIALGETINPQPEAVQYSGVRFFAFEEGREINHVPEKDFVKGWPHVVDFCFNLKAGDKVNRITSSLNRYGQLILQAGNRDSIEEAFDKYVNVIAEDCFN